MRDVGKLIIMIDMHINMALDVTYVRSKAVRVMITLNNVEKENEQNNPPLVRRNPQISRRIPIR